MTHRFSFLLFLLFAATAAALTEENVNEQFTAAAGGKIVVDVDFGTVDVTAAAGDKVTVSAHRKIESSDEAREKDYLASAPIRITQEGNTVTVRARRQSQDKRWGWSGHVNMDAQYTVQVPKNFNADLHTSGGGISAVGLEGEVKADTSGGKMKFAQLKGPLEARTSGGSILVEGCEGPLEVATSGGRIDCNGGKGSLEARTSGGAIEVRNFSGDTEVKTSGGKLILENINGRISGKTSAGSITAALVDPVPGDVSLYTSAGSIDLAVPAKAALSVEARASMGSIRTEIPMLATRSSDDRLEGTLNGGGKSVVLKASVGSITIRPNAEPTATR